MNDELAELNLLELLERLEPIPEPEAVSLLPQTAGWLWLGLLLLGVACWLYQRRAARRRAEAYRREALEEIDAARGDPVALAEILRRTALAAFPREDVAGLYGERWLAFLDAAVGGAGFREGPGAALAYAPYASTSEASAELEALVIDWVRRHQRAAP